MLASSVIDDQFATKRVCYNINMVPSDTDLEISDKQLALLRAMTPDQRVDVALQLSCDVINASRNAIMRVRPELDEHDRRFLFIELHYGRELANQVRKYCQGRSK